MPKGWNCSISGSDPLLFGKHVVKDEVQASKRYPSRRPDSENEYLRNCVLCRPATLPLQYLHEAFANFAGRVPVMKGTQGCYHAGLLLRLYAIL